MRRPLNARGFTLIELSVVLAVIVTLALVLTPAIGNYVNDARVARTRSETQTIASAIIQFYRDTGFYPMWSRAQNGGPGTTASRVDLLVSGGNIPAIAQASPWTTGTSAPLADLLVTNTAGFRMRAAGMPSGWAGPYLSSPIEGDAWSNRFMVNVGLLDATSGPLAASGDLKRAVWVISPGANGTIETVYSQPTVTAILGGDDIGIRLQ